MKAQGPVAPDEPVGSEGQGLALAMHEDEEPEESTSGEDAGAPDLTGEGDFGAGEAENEGEDASESTEGEDEFGAAAAEAEEEPPAELPKMGYLVFPDSTEQAIPESQWLIGRADVSKFLSDPKKANEISRGHLTVFQDGDQFYVEDGSTMVQRKASTNKTWLLRGGSRTLVTGTGRTELQDGDEIDIAELVKLQFVLK